MEMFFSSSPGPGSAMEESIVKSKESEKKKKKKAWLLAPTHVRRPENQVEPSRVESLKASL